MLPRWYFSLNFGDVPLMILGKYGDFAFIDEPMAVYRQTGTGVSTKGIGHWLFNFRHFKEWIRIWEYGNNYFENKYQAESLNTILYFYYYILIKYNYSFRILIMSLKYNLFESQLSYFHRLVIFYRLIKRYAHHKITSNR